MTRNQFEDVVPPGGKRSIRDIPLPKKHSVEAPVYETKPEIKTEVEEDVPEEFDFDSSEKRVTGWKWILGILFLLIASYALSFVFHHATITITPQSVNLAIDDTFIAKTEASPDQIKFDTVSQKETASKAVAASGEKDVTRKASGQVIIYNNFSAAPQELVATTRFESADGKIYRIDKDVIVPGQTIVNGKKVPGSIEVTVFADQAGDSFNTEATTFTIPGFKGGAKYESFTARGQGPISGGFVGKEQSVESTLQISTEAELKKSLETNLKKSIMSLVPADFVMLPGAYTITYKSLPTVSEGNQAKISIEGVITAQLFKKTDLENAFSSSASRARGTSTEPSDLVGKMIRINSFENIAVALTNIEGNSVTFTAKGEVKAFSYIDELKISEDIKGKPRKNILAIMASYPEIDRAEVKITPPWIMSVPKNAEDITIINTSTALTKLP